MAHVYHWKHGWIPLDHVAALSKAKGSHTLAARYLEAAHSHEAGFGETIAEEMARKRREAIARRNGN